MKYPQITPAVVSGYHNTTEKFVYVLELCETTATAHDTNINVRIALEFVESLLESVAAELAAAQAHSSFNLFNSN
jgi:hypothetical protein